MKTHGYKTQASGTATEDGVMAKGAGQVDRLRRLTLSEKRVIEDGLRLVMESSSKGSVWAAQIVLEKMLDDLFWAQAGEL